MRSDVRRWTAAAVVAAALLGVAAARQGGGINLPPGAILLSTTIPCPWGTTEYTRAAGRMLMPIPSSAGPAAVAATTARTSGDAYSATERARLHGSVRHDTFIRLTPAAGFSSLSIFHSGPTPHNPQPVFDPPFIRILACVVD